MRFAVVVEAIPWAWVVASIPRRIGLCLASISLQICHVFAAIFATIGSRSGVDRGVRASSITGRSMRGESPPILRHNLLARGSIAPRSWSSSTMFNRRTIALSLDGRSRLSDPVRRDRDVNQPFDDLMRVPRQPSDRDRLSMKISGPIAINSKPSVDADRELLRMPRGAR